MKKLEIKKWQLPLLVMKLRREIDKHMDTVQIFQDIPEVIAELYRKRL